MFEFYHCIDERRRLCGRGEVGWDGGKVFAGDEGCVFYRTDETFVLGVGSGELQNAFGLGWIDLSGSFAGSGGGGGATMFAVVAVDVNWSWQLGDCFSELFDRFLRYAVVPVWDVNILHGDQVCCF